MDTKKLVDEIRDLLTVYTDETKAKAVALLTRAFEEANEEGFQTAMRAYGCSEDIQTETQALRAQVAELREATQRLICKVNKVTAPHRHGAQITIMSLDELSNEQIETEAALARVGCVAMQ